MSTEITAPVILDSTGQDIADALTDVADAINAGNATAAMLAYVENGSTATQPYAKGTYICWKGLLYTADTAINAGDAFYSTGVSKNLTAVGGGGFNSVCRLVSYSITHLAFRVNNVVFVHFRSNVDLGGGTTTVFLSGLPVPDTSKSHTWQFPVNVNNGLTQILPGYVTVESNGDLSILVVNNGSIVTSGRFTVSIFLMYLAA